MMRAPTTTITQDEAWAGFSWQDSEAEVVKQWRVTLEDLVPPDAQESARSPDRLRPPARPELTRIEKMNRVIEISGIKARTCINDGYKEMRKENYIERAHTHEHVVMVWVNGAVRQHASQSVTCTKDNLEDAEVDAFCIAATKLLGKAKLNQIVSQL